jgi:hypothetical protein
VIAGSLTTGLVQFWIDSRQRRIDSRAAARVVWGSLSGVKSFLDQSQSKGYWTVGAPQSLGPAADIWEAHQITLGRVVNSHGYRFIDVAFEVIHDIRAEISSADDLEKAYDETFGNEYHDWRMLALGEGCEVARKAGQSLWDRYREPREMKARQQRVEELGYQRWPA